MSARQILWTAAIALAVIFASNRLSIVRNLVGPK